MVCEVGKIEARLLRGCPDVWMGSKASFLSATSTGSVGPFTSWQVPQGA